MIKDASQDEVKQATLNVTDAVNEAGDAVVNGHPETGAVATSAAVIVTYEDGNITTRIAGLVDKTRLYGALVEAILSIHELERANLMARMEAEHAAFIEKYTESHTDH